MALDRTKLPSALYTAAQSRALDHRAITDFDLPGFKLMQRAGHAAFSVMLSRWPDIRSVTLLCGGGNNGGDGFVMAVLAQQKGLAVQVLHLGDDSFAAGLSGEALEAWQAMAEQGVTAEPYRSGRLFTGDLIVDAMLGTGLSGEVGGPARQAIEQLNRTGKPVLSVDIPSGLCSDTGAVLGVAVKASCTVTFIGVKRGLLTHEAVDYTGHLYFDNLRLPDELYEQVEVSAFRTSKEDIRELLPARSRSAHKGHNGHVLVIGGDLGMGGAALMAAEAVVRSGAGMVSLATRPEHVAAALVRIPEVMTHGVTSAGDLERLLCKADIVVVGPGLGQRAWGQAMLQKVLAAGRLLVVDADALNLVSLWGLETRARDRWILTPHPGEAGRLLDSSVKALQNNRFLAAEKLQQVCGGVVVLKGAGSLVTDGDALYLCNKGNPGMAAGGMGDVLSGIIGGLWAQGLKAVDAARIGVYLHATAADLVAEQQGERGMLATDLTSCLPRVINGK
ncbi:MAG: NAD(P)H-hydrate dehydratase [Pontibacterium sp.]